TLTSLTASPDTTVIGQPVTLTASVTSPGGTPTGTVTFLNGSAVLGTVALDATGHATLSVSLAAGVHDLTAQYAGNASFAASSSDVAQVTVNPAATFTTISASANPAVIGQPVTFRATVTAVAPGFGTPTGSVTFLEDGTTQVTVALDASGVAT